MKTGKRQILAALLCLLASALFVAAFSLFVKQIQPIPETQGKIEQVFFERNEETGELTQKKITSVLGKDVTAVRLSELTDLGALTKVNYVPGRFIQPTEIPADNQIVDLREDFEFAEKGTLFFVVMNLDPSAEDFSEQVQRLERYKAGDYWHFTISLPQIFSACNIYMNSQLIASHGEIEDYNFIDFTTSYDKLTENFSAETGRTVVNLSFYTRREAISDDWASARVLCIHYQSNGGFYSGARDSALLGSEEAILSTGQVTRLVLMGGCVLSAMVFAVLTVLSALRRTTNFFPELIMVAGTLTVFLARYCFATSSAAPLFWISASRAAIFLLLGAAIYSVGKSRKTRIAENHFRRAGRNGRNPRVLSAIRLFQRGRRAESRFDYSQSGKHRFPVRTDRDRGAPTDRTAVVKDDLRRSDRRHRGGFAVSDARLSRLHRSVILAVCRRHRGRFRHRFQDFFGNRKVQRLSDGKPQSRG